MTAQQLRTKRIRAVIPARLVAARSGVDPSRLCHLERGYVSATTDELERIGRAIAELASARKEVEAVAERVGWTL
jgi:hypothetical protein